MGCFARDGRKALDVLPGWQIWQIFVGCFVLGGGGGKMAWDVLSWDILSGSLLCLLSGQRLRISVLKDCF